MIKSPGKLTPFALVASEPSVRFEWACLFKFKLCISNLSATQLTLVRLDSRLDSHLESSQQPEVEAAHPDVKLPVIRMPLPFTVDTLSVGRLRLETGEAPFDIEHVNSSLAWRGTRFTLRQLAAKHGDFALHAKGTIRFEGDYPLNFDGSLEAKSDYGPLAFKLGGDLNTTQITAELSGKIAAALTLEARPLAVPLRWHADIAVPELPISDTAEDALTLQKIELRIEGDETIYKGELKAKAASGKWPDPNPVVLQFTGDDSRLTISRAAIQLAEGRVQGEAHLNLPQDESPLFKAAIDLNWSDIDPGFLNPALEGNLNGRAALEIDIKSDDEPPALARLQINDSTLSGEFENQPLSASVRARWHQREGLSMHHATMALGGNRLDLNDIDTTDQLLTFGFDFNHLAPLVALLGQNLDGQVKGQADGRVNSQVKGQVKGRVNGQLQVSLRDPLQPKLVSGRATLKALSFGDLSIDNTQLAISGLSFEPMRLDALSIEADSVAQGEQVYKAVRLEASANATALAANLSLANDDWGSAKLACSMPNVPKASLNELDKLSGSCSKLAWSPPSSWRGHDWINQETIELNWHTRSSQLTIHAFCLSEKRPGENVGKLCLKKQATVSSRSVCSRLAS